MNEPPFPSTSASQTPAFRTTKSSGPKKILKTAVQRPLQCLDKPVCGQGAGGGGTREPAREVTWHEACRALAANPAGLQQATMRGVAGAPGEWNVGANQGSGVAKKVGKHFFSSCSGSGGRGRKHGVAVCGHARGTAGHAPRTTCCRHEPTLALHDYQTVTHSPAHTPEHKSTWNDTHANTLTPIQTRPAACTRLQTKVSIGWEPLKRRFQKKTQKLRRPGVAAFGQACVGTRGGATGAPKGASHNLPRSWNSQSHTCRAVEAPPQDHGRETA